jgi:predicted DNA repair protein MutK
MAGASLLALLDDIASVLDDVALMTKIAAKKTAGVLGDDLALNAEQVSGIRAERELPVVWAVAKGSLRNKLILVPTALAISGIAPALIIPLLMLGGVYLCFEGFEKLAHPLLHSHADDDAHQAELAAALASPDIDLATLEQHKIQGAVRTDFVLSAEIIVISLGTVATAAFATQVAVVSGIALIMTIGVYGLVALIVKLDDAGLYLCQKPGIDFWTKIQHKAGQVFLLGAPYLMKLLSIVGTVAMFMVGGGILVHGIPDVHHFIEHIAQNISDVPIIGGILETLTSPSLNALAGIVSGALALGGVTIAGRIYKRFKTS